MNTPTIPTLDISMRQRTAPNGCIHEARCTHEGEAFVWSTMHRQKMPRMGSYACETVERHAQTQLFAVVEERKSGGHRLGGGDFV